MDPSIVTAGAALGGSLVGAVASFTSTWLTQRYQGRRDYLARQVSRRELLYSEFITESARRYSEALTNHLERADSMVPLYGLLSRIRLTASAEVLGAAESVLYSISEQFVAPNLTSTEISALARASDPLRKFSETCRVELSIIDRDR